MGSSLLFDYLGTLFPDPGKVLKQLFTLVVEYFLEESFLQLLPFRPHVHLHREDNISRSE